MGVRGLESRPWLQSYSLGPGGVAGACMDEAAGRADRGVSREQWEGLGHPGAVWKGQRDTGRKPSAAPPHGALSTARSVLRTWSSSYDQVGRPAVVLWRWEHACRVAEGA